MHTINNVVKWSAYMSGITTAMVLSGIFAGWATLQFMVYLVQNF